MPGRQTGLGIVNIEDNTLSTLEGRVSGQFSNLGINVITFDGIVSGVLLQ